MDNTIRITHIKPVQMTDVFFNNTPIFAEEIKDKHHIGLWIQVSGIIKSVSLGGSFTTFYFDDSDGICIGANFDKPIDNEVSLLNKNMEIEVVGQVFNVAEKLVILDHCKLVRVLDKKPMSDETKEAKVVLPHNKEKDDKWWEKTWVQLITFLSAIIGIFGTLYAIFK